MAPRTLIATVALLLLVAIGAGFLARANDEPAVARSMLEVGTAADSATADDGRATDAADSEESTESSLTEPANDTTFDTVGSEVPASEGAPAVGDLVGGCLLGGEHTGTGEVIKVDGTTTPTSQGTPVRYSVEVEEGLSVDPDCFAAVVDTILTDERSWGGGGRLSLERVDGGPVDFSVALLSPALTDAECAPLETNGIFSCWSGERAAINVWRWEHGTPDYSDALDVYREYVINHEVGHALAHGHVDCPGPGQPAPIMQQQTKGLDGCTRNGYPLENER